MLEISFKNRDFTTNFTGAAFQIRSYLLVTHPGKINNGLLTSAAKPALFLRG